MRADQRQINDGSWNPDEAVEANLVIEHRPLTYVKWLFADIDPEELFSTGTESRRITFLGDVGVVVKKDGGEDPDTGAEGVFMMRNGQQTVVNLPVDADYEILIENKKDGTLTVFDILVSPQLLRSRPGRMYIGKVQSGLYRMNVRANNSPDRPESASEGEKKARFSTRKFTYSPAVIMSEELDATRSSFLSLSSAIIYGTVLMNGLGLILALCVLVFFIHRIRIRRGHKPYSDWYVILPHLIFIAVFAALTQYLTLYMFTIGSARAQCAAVTLLIIALLAIRGAMRSMKPSAFLTSVILLLVVPLAGAYYNELPIDSFSTVNAIVFFAMVVLLTIVAISNFKREKKEFVSAEE